MLVMNEPSPSRRIAVSHLNNDRFAIHVRGHRLVVDQPQAVAEAEAGPTPVELMVGSLAACAAHYAQSVLARQGDDLSVDVVCDYQMSDGGPHRVAAVDITIGLPPGLSEARRAAILRAAHHCTVHETLATPPAITITLGAAHDVPPAYRAENADAAAMLS
jgi:putative redox protein